jgi:phenylacetate-CoA ligase
MTAADTYDRLETRPHAEREADLMQRLPAQVARAQTLAPAFAERLAGVDATAVTSRAALAALPVTRKHELLERQKAQRSTDPFGGVAAPRRAGHGGCSSRPARSTNPKARQPTIGVPHGRCSRPAFAQATWSTTASATTSRPPVR